MIRLVALLGSINVGGNRIKMAELRAALIKVGFVNVATVTASGNVLFDGHAEEADAHAAKIAAVLQRDFGIDTFAIVLSPAGLLAAIEENPFLGSGEDNLVHVHFPESRPHCDAFAQLEADHAGRGAERLAPGDGVLHIDFVDGVGKSKLTGPFIAKRLRCRGTARNIRSLRRIAEAMN